MAKKGDWLKTVKPWFILTTEERLFVAGIVGILLIGLIARYAYLAGQQAEPYEPAAGQTSP
jgi:hypothetical protein